MEHLIPRSEHPCPNLQRNDWLNLNGSWDFEIDDAKVGMFKQFYDRTELKDRITVPFCPESRLSGLAHTDFMNAVWYHRSVEIPNEWKNKRILWHIGACDYKTTVFVNGKQAGTHCGGYTSFSFDITDLLYDGVNHLTVYAEDDLRGNRQFSGKQSHALHSNGCFYTRTTGIWQTVWLEAVAPAYILSYKVYPNISEPSATLSVCVNSEALGGRLQVTALYEGRTVAIGETDIVSQHPQVCLPLKEKHLWDVGCGNLYDLQFTLTTENGIDRVNGYFGLREVALSKEHGLQINGKTVFGRFVLDQGFYPDGVITAPSDDALQFDIEASMALGFNGARLHQKVFEPRFLYHADTHGYLVWGEAGNWGFDHTDPANVICALPEWMEEVERDFSHPSIIGWCPFNETWDFDGKRHSIPLIDTFYDVTKAMDPTRPVIANSGSFPTTRTDVHDVHDYEQDPQRFRANYAEMENGILHDQLDRSYPKRQVYKTELPVFVSEYGGIKWAPKAEGDSWGYGNSVTTEEEFFQRLRGLTDAILDNPMIFAFCYTQLTDVEQEQNGLLTYDRKWKFPAEKIASIFQRTAAIESLHASVPKKD